MAALVVKGLPYFLTSFSTRSFSCLSKISSMIDPTIFIDFLHFSTCSIASSCGVFVALGRFVGSIVTSPTVETTEVAIDDLVLFRCLFNRSSLRKGNWLAAPLFYVLLRLGLLALEFFVTLDMALERPPLLGLT